MKYVKNVKTIPKRWSAQTAVLSAVVALQEALPVWEPIVPENVFVYIAAGLMTLSIVMQALKQPNLPE
jgi:hypothetical protein